MHNKETKKAECKGQIENCNKVHGSLRITITERNENRVNMGEEKY